MRVHPVPQWIGVTLAQQGVFLVLYGRPTRKETYSRLFEEVTDKFPSMSKPRLSDILRALETKGLVARVNPKGTWAIPAPVVSRLSEQASEKTEKILKARKKASTARERIR
jgi:DNA-binding HxlR family transcriptional regulator